MEMFDLWTKIIFKSDIRIICTALVCAPKSSITILLEPSVYQYYWMNDISIFCRWMHKYAKNKQDMVIHIFSANLVYLSGIFLGCRLYLLSAVCIVDNKPRTNMIESLVRNKTATHEKNAHNMNVRAGKRTW